MLSVFGRHLSATLGRGQSERTNLPDFFVSPFQAMGNTGTKAGRLERDPCVPGFQLKKPGREVKFKN